MWRKCSFLVIMAFLVSLSAFPQDSTHNKTPKLIELSREGYNRLANRSFAGLVTGQKNSTIISNSATIDPADGRITLQGSLPIGKKTGKKHLFFLTFNLGGELISDSYTILFNDSKLNTNAFLSGQFHFRFKKDIHIQYWESEWLNMGIRRQGIEKEKKIRMLYVENDSVRAIQKRYHDSIKMELIRSDMQKRWSDYTIIDSSIRSLGKTSGSNGKQIRLLSDSLNILTKNLEKLREDSISLGLRIDSLDCAIKHNTIIRRSLKGKVEKEFDRKLDNLELDAPIEGIRLGWFSLAGGASQKTYYSYSPEEPFEDQINKHSLTTWHVGLTYNYYVENADPKFVMYMNAGAGVARDNNTALLKTQKIEQSWGYQNSAGDTSRTIENTYNAYTDDVEHKTSMSLFSNIYLIHSSKSGALHIFPTLKFYDGTGGLFNLGLGYAFSFRSKKSDKPISNAEFYFELIDIGDQLDVGSKFYKRNTIGVRFTLPFYFLN